MAQEEKSATYILYRRGHARVVSREEWERSWRLWWARVSG